MYKKKKKDILKINNSKIDNSFVNEFINPNASFSYNMNENQQNWCNPFQTNQIYYNNQLQQNNQMYPIINCIQVIKYIKII